MSMNGPEAFRRLVQQIQAVSRTGGGGSGPGGKGALAGSGLLIALVGGGLLLNASLFNGSCVSQTPVLCSHLYNHSRWWSPRY